MMSAIDQAAAAPRSRDGSMPMTLLPGIWRTAMAVAAVAAFLGGDGAAAAQTGAVPGDAAPDPPARRATVLAETIATVPGAASSGPPAPVETRTSPAQQSIAAYRRDFGTMALPAPCQRPKDSEVVVCGTGGRGGSPDRIPLPDARGPPDHARLARGEIRPDMAAPPGMGTCLSQDQGARCGGGVSLIGAAIAGVRIVRALIDPEGASDAADARPAPRG